MKIKTTILGLLVVFAGICEDTEKNLRNLPVYMKGEGYSSTMSGKIEGNFIYETLRYEDKVACRTTSSLYETTFVLGDRGVISASMRLLTNDWKLTAWTGYDYRTVVRKDDTYFCTFYLDGERRSQSKVVIEEDYVLATDTLFVQLQSRLLKGDTNSFTAPLLLTAQGIRMDTIFSFFKTNSLIPLFDNYDVPDDMRKFFSDDSEVYYVYELKLPGMLGFILNAKFYAAFRPYAPYPYVAFWGGILNNQQYIYCESFISDEKSFAYTKDISDGLMLE